MRSPLDITIVNPGGAFGVRAVAGTGLPDNQGVKRHIGVDLQANIQKPVYAPSNGSGVTTAVDSSGLKVLEVRIGDYSHRFLHLSSFVRTSGNVNEGEVIAYTGNTGNVAPHLHWDVRKAGTAWNASFYNYIDPMSLLNKGEQPMTTQEATAILDAFFGRFAGRKIKQSELDEYIPVLMSGYPDNFFKKAVEFDEVKQTVGGNTSVNRDSVIKYVQDKLG